MKKIVILGGGESGYGSAVLAKAKGFEVFLSEAGTLKKSYKEKIEAEGIAYEEGGHTLDKVLEANEIIKSPGVPDSANIVQAALSKGIRVISEIEFAARYTMARKICITGSNGKTTTTTLIYEIMKRAGMNVAVAGNIGQSFALSIARATVDYDWYVIELSSFQLDGLYEFKADIALLLNITPDHLDRYDYDMSKYVASKLRILQNQSAAEYFIYNADDPELLKILPATPFAATPLPFSLKGAVGGAYCNGESIIFEDNSMAVSQMALKGKHNVANALSAVMACSRAGVDFGSIARTLREFAGVEHRLERVTEIEGVEYINDSKATNTDSVWYALDSMTRPTVWIAGGKDKGNDYESLRELAVGKVKALVCMGVNNEKLVKFFTGVVPAVYDTHSLAEALEVSQRVAESGATVLLSPACASFDLFKSYEQRGSLFKEAVLSHK